MGLIDIIASDKPKHQIIQAIMAAVLFLPILLWALTIDLPKPKKAERVDPQEISISAVEGGLVIVTPDGTMFVKKVVIQMEK